MIGPKAIIHIDRLLSNYDRLKSHLNQKRIMAVVKADAYGHGSVQCARALENHGCDSFAVFSFSEALELRRGGVVSDILIFSKTQQEYIEPALQNNLTLNASSLSDIAILDSYKLSNGSIPNFHVKFDTGMTRLGISSKDAATAFENIKKNIEAECKGLYSHYATADEGDLSFANHQLSIFNEVTEIAVNKGVSFDTIHFSNSGATINLNQSKFDQVRIGMLLYGAFPSNEVSKNLSIEPVMEYVASLVEVRRVKMDTPVSYGGVYKTPNDCTIGVVQCGFADGIPREWYDQGFVGYKGKTYKIAGRICMDQFMVNFEDDSPKIGDEVLLFGKNESCEISMENIADTLNSTPYVIATGIKGRTQKEFKY